MFFNPKGGARPGTAAYNQITDAPLSVGWFPWTGAYFAVAEKFCEDFGGEQDGPFLCRWWARMEMAGGESISSVPLRNLE